MYRRQNLLKCLLKLVLVAARIVIFKILRQLFLIKPILTTAWAYFFGSAFALSFLVMAIRAFFLVMSLFVFNVSWAAPACVDLLKLIDAEAPKPVNLPVGVVFKSERILLQKMSQASEATGLKLKPKIISENPQLATMELLKMMVHTTSYSLSDKNVLYKNSLELGMPMGDGYSLGLKYESDGRENPIFRLDAVEVVTPTGFTYKVSKEVLSRTSFSLAKDSFELPADVYPHGRRIHAEIPLTIEGKSLTEIDRMSGSLELFNKTELREIADQKTYGTMKRKFFFRKTKALFKKYFIAAPFKTIANIAPTLLLASAISYGVASIPKTTDVVPLAPQASWVTTSINQASARSVAPEVKIQFNQFMVEADAKIKSGASEVPQFGPASATAPKYKFSEQHMTWVFEQKGSDGVTKTFIVLTEESTGTANDPMKYLVMQIDPVKYAEMIKFIRTQGHVLTQ